MKMRMLQEVSNAHCRRFGGTMRETVPPRTELELNTFIYQQRPPTHSLRGRRTKQPLSRS